MKKIYRLSILLTFLFFGKNLVAQNVFKVGPSLMYSWSWFDEKLYLNFGADVSFEFAVGEKSSIDMGAIFHYGDHKSIFNQNVLRILTQILLLILAIIFHSIHALFLVLVDH